jgi:putative endonuclease
MSVVSMHIGDVGGGIVGGMRQFFVYILASKSHRLYVGVTNNLERRLWEHRAGWSSFTARYRINRLVYWETRPHPMQAIRREKAIKHLSRAEKIALIEATNPRWKDLADGWFDPPNPAGRDTSTADPPGAKRPEDDSPYSPS